MTGMSARERLLQFQRSCLEYLDQTGLIKTIKEKCRYYVDCQEKAFHFMLPVDPMDLLDLDADLGNLILNCPTGASKIFQEVIYTTISSLQLLPQCASQSQVVVIFKLQSLPKLPGYRIRTAKELIQQAKSKRFLHYEGIVVGMSTLHKYTKSTRYACMDEQCEGSEGNRFIRVHIPGARETQTIRKDFTCTFCGMPLKEDVSCRVLGDKLTLEMADEQSFCTSATDWTRFQTITTYLRDELVHRVEIGQKCAIIGMPIHNIEQQHVALEANNIVIEEQISLSETLIQTHCESLPDSIKFLYEDRKHSPWSFPLSLAYAFGGRVSPAGTYLHLKLGMLLHLVGTKDSHESRGLDLLAVGNDTLILDRLLQYGASFADRHITSSQGVNLTANVCKDRHGTDSCYIEGGCLLLANGGVCVIPDLSCSKKATRHLLQQCIERNEIMVSIPSKLCASGCGHQMALPLHCQVWAYTDPMTQSKAQHFEDLSNKVDMSMVSKSLADVFGMVYFAGMCCDTYAEYMSVQHTLLSAMDMQSPSLIPDQHFQQFIDMVRQLSLQFGESAKMLIKGYYVASRRVRATGIHTSTVPQNAVNTITSLAASHARLSLRCEVREEDAVMAILLYEESITHRQGNSVLNIKPLQHIKDNNIQAYIGPEHDVQMKLIHQQIKQFVKTYAGDLDKMCEE